ncbi:MAG: multiheme c-type cytochrome [Verrucomicrobiota bacterium]
MNQSSYRAMGTGRSSGIRLEARALLLVLALAWPLLARPENTNVMLKPPVPLPGGLSLHPVVTSVGKTQDLVTVRWFGIQGPFQVQHSTVADTNLWSNLGEPTFGSSLTTALPGELGFFRVLSGRPVTNSQAGGTMNYVGASYCSDCHQGAHQNWELTSHAKAFDTLKAIKQEKNSECLVCHTVGFGTPVGFKDEATTPHLAGVQCENCHGPAGNHVANIRDRSARPKVTIAAEVCGGCHNDFHHPTFDEWKGSPHGTVDPEVIASILAQGEPRMLSCGACHSGAVRSALLKRVEQPSTPLPSREDAAYFAITCSVCHDAHPESGGSAEGPEAQLRNPTFSTINFSYSTSTNTSFAQQYNPNVQLCGQCHNMRGARWQDTSRPPHHSPQYNLLIGQGAYDLGRSSIAGHGQIPNQCVQCHTHPHPADPVTAENPNYTGHGFEVRTENCTICHISNATVEIVKGRTQTNTKNQIESVRALLDSWATNKAPAELLSKYGRLAWEYSAPGELSNPGSDPKIVGPTAAEQAKIPDAIKQARLNLYLVQHDGSFGVHNGEYSRYLLNVAKTNVTTALGRL